MVIVRQGTIGTIAIALPNVFKPLAEKIHEGLCTAYGDATVRVVVNHCLSPEIVRADRVDAAYARGLVEQLRSHAPAASEPSSLHEKIAACLGWAVEETRAFSLRALQTLVQKHDARLAAQVERACATDPGEKAYCCFCSGVVEPADYVIYAHAPDSDRPAHKRCVDAKSERGEAPDPVRLLAKAMLTTIHLPAHRALVLDTFSDEQLRAMSAVILSRSAA